MGDYKACLDATLIAKEAYDLAGKAKNGSDEEYEHYKGLLENIHPVTDVLCIPLLGLLGGWDRGVIGAFLGGIVRLIGGIFRGGIFGIIGEILDGIIEVFRDGIGGIIGIIVGFLLGMACGIANLSGNLGIKRRMKQMENKAWTV